MSGISAVEGEQYVARAITLARRIRRAAVEAGVPSLEQEALTDAHSLLLASADLITVLDQDQVDRFRATERELGRKYRGVKPLYHAGISSVMHASEIGSDVQWLRELGPSFLIRRYRYGGTAPLTTEQLLSEGTKIFSPLSSDVANALAHARFFANQGQVAFHVSAAAIDVPGKRVILSTVHSESSPPYAEGHMGVFINTSGQGDTGALLLDAVSSAHPERPVHLFVGRRGGGIRYESPKLTRAQRIANRLGL